ncbi:response regulator transcription factor [Reichenbachiella versicolor]|uniref:response regulator transcription factor n=1 Tax=Reichenbachiella versicolor TaxID=1821036 RepID=UPI000D6E93B5|nr:helix-turn-helix transcriptional regulator [Reichenbachiella versicolor]
MNSLLPLNNASGTAKISHSNLHDSSYQLANFDKTSGAQSFSSHKINRLHREEYFRKLNQVHFDTLTNREREVLTKIVLGLKVQSVAEELFISIHTVQQHKKNIKKKLNTRSMHDLMMYALAFDLI